MFVYVTRHIHSETVCTAFATGARAALVPPHRLMPGAAAVYGILRGCREIILQAQKESRTWFYIDRGYFKASRDADYSGYFRVSRDSYQHDGSGEFERARWEALKLRILDWKNAGNHILICPPGRAFASYRGFDADEWLTSTVAMLRNFTDRPIRIREKPQGANKNVPLSFDLKNCWALVAHSSNAAVEALLNGVPVFCTAPCAAASMGSRDLKTIESPRRPEDRERWASALAANQWTIEEMRNGSCWKELTQFYGESE